METVRDLQYSLINFIDDTKFTIENLARSFRNKTDDLIETIMDVQISELCNNNLKSIAYRKRLMNINAMEKDTTLSMIGENAVLDGKSRSLNSDKEQHPGYVSEYDYIKNYFTHENDNKTSVTINQGVYGERVNLVPDDKDLLKPSDRWQYSNRNSILKKTKDMFYQNKINTIISRFHTENKPDDSDVKTVFGLSHGNNLLTREAEKNGAEGRYEINGYNNPYCRVWTHHYQYNKLDRLIRPFVNNTSNRSNEEVGEPITKNEFHYWGSAFEKKDSNGYAWKSDTKNGWDKSVLNDNGFVNITPKYGQGGDKIHTKQCMFSIENLAWKGYNPYSFEKALSWEQRGPMGGRIMWFPPYGITFNETTQANWTNHTFIGRGEDVYTYTNTIRSGNLSFMMLVDHPSIIDYVSWHQGDNDGRTNQTENSVGDNDLLRFFAGCDSGTLKKNVKPTPLTDEYTEKEEEITAEAKKQAPLPPEPKEEEIPEEIDSFTFYVFYPNNYSGVYDRMGSNVEAIAYLLNGSNSQKRGSSYKDDVPLKFDSLNSFIGVGYEMSNLGITNTSDNKCTCINGTSITWSQAMSKGLKEYPEDKTDKRKWWYRIDGEYSIPKNNGETYKNTYDQTLLYNENYKDTQGFSLNMNANAVKEAFGETDNDKIYSLSEVAAAMTENESIRKYLGEENSERVNKLIELFNDESFEITKLTGIGYSNSHGNNSKSVNDKRNSILAQERINTVIDWIKSVRDERFKDLQSDSDIVDISSIPSVGINSKNVSSIDAKKWRSAKITIEYRRTVKVSLSETKQSIENGNETISQGVQKYIGYETVDINGKIYYKDKNGKLWMKVNDEGGDMDKLVMVEIGEDGSINRMFRKTGKSDANRENENNTYRYDQEYHFYKLLKQKDPIIFNSLMKKIQYFDPAFHSMTPEGFNARLTFLQQCTRQGNTIGASDTTNSTASNLAFGRPPFCVLRLGDFYNQMIVIDNISVNYDPLVWDLNIEGVGVQPLLANVTISFKFIGGGDMNGPIRRLQNAMTFNYYANARLYDNRADRIEYPSDDIAQGAIDNNPDYSKSYLYKTEMYNKNNK